VQISVTEGHSLLLKLTVHSLKPQAFSRTSMSENSLARLEKNILSLNALAMCPAGGPAPAAVLTAGIQRGRSAGWDKELSRRMS
jgi:hypothetical protein